MIIKQCPICGKEAEFYTFENRKGGTGYLESAYSCPHCGKFIIPSENSFNMTIGSDKNRLFYLSCFLFETRRKHEAISIRLDKDELNRIFGTMPLSLDERIEKLLSYINMNSTYFGEMIDIDPEVFYSNKLEELAKIIEELEEHGYVKSSMTTCCVSASITIMGIDFIKKVRTEENNNSCFVAMCFSEEMSAVYEKCIRPACLEAGYKPIRVDEEQYNGDITDRIIARIKSTKFTIADMSFYRGGVYYEAGYAQGLGKEVILSCNKEWFDGDPNENRKIHFDINHLNILVWEHNDLEGFKQKLVDRIIATVDRGTYDDSANKKNNVDA